MIGRREFLKSMCAGVAMISNSLSYSQEMPHQEEPFVLDMQRKKERYLIDLRTAEGRNTVAWLLRDIEAGNIIGKPNWNTLRLAAWAQAYLTAHATHTVLDAHSGLRMRSTNRRHERAVWNSRHLPDNLRDRNFSAIDVFPFGINMSYFGNLIAMPRFGGVGFYDSHIHFDSREKPTIWVDRRPSKRKT